MTAVDESVAAEPTSGASWLESLEAAARRLGAITAVGVVLGVLVGGVGGRLAMLLLARLNPLASGVTSDDGFTIGQFTVADTLNLLLAGAFLGLLGAGSYALVRGLLIGPRWFQVLSISLGPATVVGAAIVHTDGVDFQLLHPTWLAIALFVAIPALYCALLTLIVEPLLREDSWWARVPLPLAILPVALMVPLFPLLGVLAGVWAIREVIRRTPSGAGFLAHPTLPWGARGALSVVFVMAVVDLGQDTAELI